MSEKEKRRRTEFSNEKGVRFSRKKKSPVKRTSADNLPSSLGSKADNPLDLSVVGQKVGVKLLRTRSYESGHFHMGYPDRLKSQSCTSAHIPSQEVAPSISDSSFESAMSENLETTLEEEKSNVMKELRFFDSEILGSKKDNANIEYGKNELHDRSDAIEVRKLRESNRELELLITEKDFSINHLRKQVETLNSLIQEKDTVISQQVKDFNYPDRPSSECKTQFLELNRNQLKDNFLLQNMDLCESEEKLNLNLDNEEKMELFHVLQTQVQTLEQGSGSSSVVQSRSLNNETSPLEQMSSEELFFKLKACLSLALACKTELQKLGFNDPSCFNKRENMDFGGDTCITDRIHQFLDNIIQSARKDEDVNEELQDAKFLCNKNKENFETLLSWVNEKENNYIELKELNEKVSQLNNKLKKVEVVHQENLSQLHKLHSNEIKSHEEKINKLKEKLREIDDINTKGGELDICVNELINSVEYKHSTLFNSLMERHTAQINYLQESLQQRCQYITSIEMHHQSEVAKLQQQVETLQQQNDLLIQEFESYKKSYCFNQLPGGCSSQTEELAVQLITTTGLLSAKDEIESSMAVEVNKLQNAMLELEDRHKKQVEDLKIDCLKHESMLSAREELEKQLQHRLDSLQVLLSRSQNDVSELDGTVIRLKCKLANTESQLQTIAEERDCKVKEIEDVKKASLRLRSEKDLLVSKNLNLEQEISFLNSRFVQLSTELANNKGPGSEATEVPILAQQSTEHICGGSVEEKTYATFCCQVNLPVIESQDILKYMKSNSELEDRVKYLTDKLEEIKLESEKCKLREKYQENKLKKVESRTLIEFDMIRKCDQDKISTLEKVIKELEEKNNIYMNDKESLEKVVVDITRRNEVLQKKIGLEVEIETIPQVLDNNNNLQTMIDRLNKEHENVLHENEELVKQNKSLKNEITQSWTERYEIEDKLSLVLQENKLLELHKHQLEQAHKRITGLLCDGTPSVATWIQIHKTVEKIVEEVVTLHKNNDDSEEHQANEETKLRLHTETLKLELDSKNKLIDLLNSEKTSFISVIDKLEKLLRRKEEKIQEEKLFLEKEIRKRDKVIKEYKLENSGKVNPNVYSNIDDLIKDTKSIHCSTMLKLKNFVKEQTELNGQQLINEFNLQMSSVHNKYMSQINDLKNTLNEKEEEIKNLNTNLIKEKYNLDDKDDNELRKYYEDKIHDIVIKHNKEVDFIRKDYEQELCQLRKLLSEFHDNNSSMLIEEIENKYQNEMEQLRTYFEQKCAELEKHYSEDIVSQHSRKLSPGSSISESEFLSDIYQTAEGSAQIAGEINVNDEVEQRQSMKDENGSLQQFYEKQLATLRNNYENKLVNLELKLNEEQRMGEGMLKELEKSLEHIIKTDVMGEFEKERSKLEEFYKGKLEAELGNEKEKHEIEIDKIKLKHDEELESLNLSWNNKLIEEISKSSVDTAIHKIELENMIRNELELEMNKKIEEIKKNMLDKQKNTSPSVIDCDKLNEILNIERKNMAEHYQKVLEDVLKNSEEKLNECVQSQKEMVEKLILEHDNDMREMKQKNDKLIEEYKSELVSCQDELEQLKTKSANEHEQDDGDHSVKSLTLYYENLIKKMENDFKSRQVNLEEQLNSYEGELINLRTSCEKTLQEQVTLAKFDALSSIEQQIQLYLSSDPEQKIPAELQELSNRFNGKYKQELMELEKKHQGEVSRIKTEYEDKIKRRQSLDARRTPPRVSLEKSPASVDENEVLKEMVTVLRRFLLDLLKYFSECENELNENLLLGCDSSKLDETLYQSIYKKPNEGLQNSSVLSLNKSSEINFDVSAVLPVNKRVRFAPDLSSFVSLFDENNLSTYTENSSVISIQFNKELETCLTQLKHEAATLLTLSRSVGWPTIVTHGNNLEETNSTSYQTLPTVNNDDNKSLTELEKERNELRDKMVELEEHNACAMREINLLKSRLREIECKSKETVVEGVGESVNVLKFENMSQLRSYAKSMMTETQTVNNVLLEEICREGDRIQEEMRRDKEDLQQQVDAGQKQIRALRSFLDEQAQEREQERDEFTREMNVLKDRVREKERERTSREREAKEAEVLESELKEALRTVEEEQDKNQKLEIELKAAVDKIWSLRGIIKDLENQIGVKNEQVDELEFNVKQHEKTIQDLVMQLDSLKTVSSHTELSEHIIEIEQELITLRRHAELTSMDKISNMKAELREIELTLIKKTKDLEQIHVSPNNDSCSSQSEDVSIGEVLSMTRCQTPEEMKYQQETVELLPLQMLQRVTDRLTKHTRAEEVALKKIKDMEMHVESCKKINEELQSERDLLFERVEDYLRETSKLKSRLEEQRCNAQAVQRHHTSELENKITKLESQIECLSDDIVKKDRQIVEIKKNLELTQQTLQSKQEDDLNKTTEQRDALKSLLVELENLKVQNKKLENDVVRMEGSIPLPTLFDTMLEDKNNEINKLEQEVSKLRSVLTVSNVTADSSNRCVQFSQPASFIEFISPIPGVNVNEHDISLQRNSFNDFRIHSSYSLKPLRCNLTPESVTLLAPLQLSPRGECLKTKDSFGRLQDYTCNEELTLLKKKYNIKLEELKKCEEKLLEKEMLDKEMEGIREQLKTTMLTVSEDKEFYKNRFQEMLENESELQSELDRRRREVTELLLQVDSFKQELLEKEITYENLEKQYKEKENELKKLNTKLEQNDEKLKEFDKNTQEMESKLSQVLDENKNLECKLKFDEDKIDSLKVQFELIEKQKELIKTEFESYKSEYENKLDQEQNTISELRLELSQLQERNVELNDKYCNIMKELENSMNDARKTTEELTNEMFQLKEENKLLRCDYGKLKKELDNVLQAKLVDNSAMVKSSDCNNFQDSVERFKQEMNVWDEKINKNELNSEDMMSFVNLMRNTVSSILENLDEHFNEIEQQSKKLMDTSIESFIDKGASGDNKHNPTGELEGLVEKLQQQADYIDQLEKCLAVEKMKLTHEKNLHGENSNLIESLRINLENSLDKLDYWKNELETERNKCLYLEEYIKEMTKRKMNNGAYEEVKMMVEIEKQKNSALEFALTKEKELVKELNVLLENEKMERNSEKDLQRLLASDLAIMQKEKSVLESQLNSIEEQLKSRQTEVVSLKRRVNLLETDVKTLTINNQYLVKREEEIAELTEEKKKMLLDLKQTREELFTLAELKTTKYANNDSVDSVENKNWDSSIELQSRNNREMEEALSRLTREREELKVIIRELERKIKSPRDRFDDTAHREMVEECEKVRRDYEKIVKNRDALKCEIIKLTQELKKVSGEVTDMMEKRDEWVMTSEDRVVHLFGRYIRAESFRKALTWQKKYLQTVLTGYEENEEKIYARLNKVTGNVKRKKSWLSKNKTKQFKLKSVALAVIVVFRMQYLVRRWKHNRVAGTNAIFGTQNKKTDKSCSSSYKGTIDPLSYQTHKLNLSRSSTSSSLVESNKVLECIERFSYIHKNLGMTGKPAN